MFENLKLGKTQHEYLWNIEQLRNLLGELESKKEANADNKELFNKYIECLRRYTKAIDMLFN